MAGEVPDIELERKAAYAAGVADTEKKYRAFLALVRSHMDDNGRDNCCGCSFGDVHEALHQLKEKP